MLYEAIVNQLFVKERYMNIFKIISVAVLGVGLFLLPNIVHAQQLSLRVEPGIAVPLTDPQAQRFGVGGAVAVKPELGLGSYLSLGPAVSFMALPSNISGIDTGTAWGYGVFLRVKRPHNEKNTGRGFSAVSPWADADLGYVRTDPLDRFGWAVAAGASVPTSDSRQLWVGPFVRYMGVHQEDDKATANTNSAKTLIIGLSFELEPHAVKKTFPVPTPQPPPSSPQPRVEPTPVPPPVPEPNPDFLRIKQKVQFALDSSVLRPSENKALEEVTRKLLATTNFNVSIEGHACILGTAEHNEKLSQRRAQAVLDYLVSHGVDRKRLTATGFGSRSPVESNNTDAGRVLNRRVEFDVTFVFKEINKYKRY